MKNQKVIIGVVVVLVLLLLGGWLMISGKKTPISTESGANKGEQKVEVKTGDTKTSIADIMGRGENVKCSYQSSSTDSGSMTATVYVSGKKMRVDSTGVGSDGKEYQSNMVSDGSYIYVWSNNEKTGMKIPAENANSSADKWKGQAQYVDPNQKVDYKCDTWSVDEGLLAPPTDVKFTDLSALQKSQCAACDYLTGEQQATCKKTLNCN
jgi:hypothetical protein